jgi:hypothetical protein
MADFQRICVTDANVWIDLHVGTILQLAFRLPFDWHAPDILLAELQHEPTGATLIALGVRPAELSGDQLHEVTGLSQIYNRPSTNDLAALVLARTLHATLVTGDRHLREAAEQEAVTVHGTLWLLDTLDEFGITTRTNLALALQRMLGANRRLPQAESQHRLRLWNRMP